MGEPGWWCCCCCCCCREKPAPPPPPQPVVVAMHNGHPGFLRPAFQPITTQPPGTITTTTTVLTSRQLPPTAYVATSPPLIIRENRQRIREPLPIPRPRPQPASDGAASAPAPSAPPAPDATEYYWTKTRLAHTEPSVMVSNGFYAGRVVAGRDTLPAILETKKQVDPRSGVLLEHFVAAHFFYKNQAGSSEDFEVLSCRKTSWQPAMGGYVAPENAIVCGRTASGRPLYFGRAFDEGKYHFGTADPEDGLLYSMANGGTWYGCVRTSQNFDILVAA
ncbi:verprolin-like [Schistocerca piceifrons]|uniref:verprolin-like n=1 Tax=Schistocerca piceifrons TaxID=274613 RepID=UPI001F5FD81D|nr:verprolin-like [Schistocerca piceifrons]